MKIKILILVNILNQFQNKMKLIEISKEISSENYNLIQINIIVILPHFLKMILFISIFLLIILWMNFMKIFYLKIIEI